MELKDTFSKRFDHQDHFDKHTDICENKHDEQNFHCKNCDKKFRVRKSLAKHKIVCLKLTEHSPWFDDNLINVAEDMTSSVSPKINFCFSINDCEGEQFYPCYTNS